MADSQPRIGVPVDCNTIDANPSHTVGEKYLAAVAHAASAIPLVLPARAAGAEQASLEHDISADDQLAELDGLFLTGSPSNVEPWRYGSRDPGVGPFDPQRDASNLALIKAALARDMPVFGVCRGLQELNVACGGSLHTAVHDVAGLSDHRDNHDAPRETRYAPSHPVRLLAGGRFAGLFGTTEITVNSLHGQGITELGPALNAEGHAPDGLIEAVRHPKRDFVIGVQWHPEWHSGDNPVSMALFDAFGDAAVAYRRRRLAA